MVTSAERHLAYPDLHYVRSGQPSLAAPLAMVKVEDVAWVPQAPSPAAPDPTPLRRRPGLAVAAENGWPAGAYDEGAGVPVGHEHPAP